MLDISMLDKSAFDKSALAKCRQDVDLSISSTLVLLLASEKVKTIMFYSIEGHDEEKLEISNDINLTLPNLTQIT
jgi:hypothetical protein